MAFFWLNSEFSLWNFPYGTRLIWAAQDLSKLVEHQPREYRGATCVACVAHLWECVQKNQLQVSSKTTCKKKILIRNKTAQTVQLLAPSGLDSFRKGTLHQGNIKYKKHKGSHWKINSCSSKLLIYSKSMRNTNHSQGCSLWMWKMLVLNNKMSSSDLNYAFYVSSHLTWMRKQENKLNKFLPIWSPWKRWQVNNCIIWIK